MQNFFDNVLASLDYWIILIVLLAGLFQKNYFKGFSLSKESGYDSALKTLMLSFVASAVYIILLKDPEKSNNWSQYFISYFAATSLYELLISPFVDFIKNKFKAGQ